MERIVAKFGGSSVADANQIRKVKAIVEADRRRRIIVVSAPGKRHAAESKLTDLLYLCHEMSVMDTDISEPFELIRNRYAEISRELGIEKGVLAELEEFREDLLRGVSRDYAVSRGEYFSARLIAEYLGAELVDPANAIVIRANTTIGQESYRLLGERLGEPDQLYVIPGFYGRDREGEVKTFSRGGSDITGAIAASAAGAVLYENWTDTSGILMADPRIIDSPQPITEITFREIREMAYMGASVFHDEAILPVREAGIPIRIKNTNQPGAPGTIIVTRLSDSELKSTEIAGIAGKKGFSMICLEKSLMNRETGFVYRLLSILNDHDVSFEQFPSSIDSVSVIVEEEQLRGLDEVLLEQIRRQLEPDSLYIEKDLALVAVVGEGMVRTVGIAGKVFSALGEAGINIRVINQGASEMNIIIGVAESEYEATVSTLYEAFVGGK